MTGGWVIASGFFSHTEAIGGGKIRIFPIKIEDTDHFLLLRRSLDAQSNFLLFEPGERKTTSEEMKDYLQSLLERENAMVFLACEQYEVVGFLSAIGGRARRNYRTVEIVVGIMEAFTGQKQVSGLGVIAKRILAIDTPSRDNDFR